MSTTKLSGLFLYGASGHGKVVAEIVILNNLQIEAFIDADLSKNKLLNYPVLHQLPDDSENLFISIGNNKARKNISTKFQQKTFPTFIHPNASFSKRSSIDKGTVIMAGATINCDVRIGKHCIINTNASVDHDCILEDFVHISPNAAIAGEVKIGEGSHIGIGVSVIPGIKIGKWCTIGAGSVIIKDVPDGATVVGNPGRIIKFNSNFF